MSEVKQYTVPERNELFEPYSTGLKCLDKNVLISPRTILQVNAAAGAGRTEFMYTLMAETFKARGDGYIYFLCYTGGFNPLRFKEIYMNRFGKITEEEANEKLSQIIYINIRQPSQLQLFLNNFTEVTKHRLLHLVIVENIGLMLLSTLKSWNYYKTEGWRVQMDIRTLVERINVTYNIPFVFTNHLAGWNTKSIRPGLGKTYFNRHITKHILLVRENWTFKLQVFDNALLPVSSVYTYYLCRHGITVSQSESKQLKSEWQKYSPVDNNQSNEMTDENSSKLIITKEMRERAECNRKHALVLAERYKQRKMGQTTELG